MNTFTCCNLNNVAVQHVRIFRTPTTLKQIVFLVLFLLLGHGMDTFGISIYTASGRVEKGLLSGPAGGYQVVIYFQFQFGGPRSG